MEHTFIRVQEVEGTFVHHNPLPVLQGKCCAVLPVVCRGRRERLSLPEAALDKGLLMMGRPGMGKSTVIAALLRQLDQQMTSRDTLIVLDPKCEYYNAFGQEGDVRLGAGTNSAPNVRWSLFKDLSAGVHTEGQLRQRCAMVAKNCLVTLENMNQPFFTEAPRAAAENLLYLALHCPAVLPGGQLCNEAFVAQVESGRYDHAIAAARKLQLPGVSGALEELLGRDDKANVTQLSVRMELKVNVAASLKHFNRGAPRSASLFSVVQAVRQRGGKRIFMQYDLSAGNTAAAATASILDLVVQTAFEQVGGRVILALDEMPQLGPCFRETLAKASSVGRSYHLDLIAGVQSLAQMTEVYTETSAKALMNNFQTQMHFSTGDPDSEEYLQRQAGDIVVERSHLVPGIGLHRGAMEKTSALTDETLRAMNVGDCVLVQTGAKPCLVHFEH